MQKLLALACVILIGIGVLLFVGGMFADGLLVVFQPVFCPDGTTLTPIRETFSRPGETTTTVYFLCNDSDGILVEDVSGPVDLVMFGSFFIGTFLFPVLISAPARRRAVQQAMAARAASRGAVSSSPVEGLDSGDDQSLAERLRELQQALEAGLVTQAEYDRKRREILDEF